MEGRPNLAGLLSGSPGSSLSSITAQKDVRNQTEGTREHRRMSGSCLSSWEPWELSVIPSQHRRMSGTRQKEPGSTEGCQREPASSLYYYIYVIRPAKYHSFIESAIFHRFIVFAKYHRFFSQKRAKTFILSRNTKTFQEKQKFFRFFLQVSKIVCIFAPSKVN